ncbi:extracellular solute-binding protein [Planotetraspora sp. A-T 1434]|uniref:extracellular solute-binding protein n=1 Tax=Planotetraspora sp. A-T 1434 TaxID=2979219 RepID=UPI0021C201F7|nr:extracellular solute-binding protein [Planotetraspora sp. A-T 1434]MCT9933939.1 extracellular solute-binding protein [Planotetraspora sp. A-T 1434]
MALRRTRLVAAVAAAGFLASACGGTGSAGMAGATPDVEAAAAVAGTPGTPGAPGSPGTGGTPLATPTTPTPVSTATATAGHGEGTLTVLALNGYVEWGGTDPTVNWVRGFEARTGCKISLKYYDPGQAPPPDDFAPASFDVISATPELAGKLIGERKVAPLDTTLVDGYDKIPKRLRGLRAFTQDDRVYGVPYLWGLNEVLYDTTKVDPEDAGAIFKDKGPVLFRDSPLSIADAALVLKSRGMDIKDPFELTPAQLDAALALFSAGKPSAGPAGSPSAGPSAGSSTGSSTGSSARPSAGASGRASGGLSGASGERAYWRDPIEVVEGFASGSVRLAEGTPYHLDVLKRGHKPVEALGERPVTGWVDSWMVSSAAAHPACAAQWLSWTASADVQRKASAWVGLAPANPGACTGRTRRICADYRVGEPHEFKGVYFAARPADYTQWAERWRQLVG